MRVTVPCREAHRGFLGQARGGGALEGRPHPRGPCSSRAEPPLILVTVLTVREAVSRLFFSGAPTAEDVDDEEPPIPEPENTRIRTR